MLRLKTLIKKKDIPGVILYFEKKDKVTDKELSFIIEKCTKEDLLKIFFSIIDSWKSCELSEKNRNDLTKAICATKKAEYIYNFACYVGGLTKVNKDDLTKAICETNNYHYIYYFAHDIKVLTKENKNDLTKAISETNNAEYIYYFALKIKDLTKENKDNLTKVICETNEAEFIYGFARDVKDLTKENKDNLTNAILKTKNAKYIYYFACDVEGLTKEMRSCLINKIFDIKDFGTINKIMSLKNFQDIIVTNEFKNMIMEFKNKSLIAKYIVIANDVELMNEIFGSDLLFENYCKTCKDNIDDSELTEFLNKVRFNYVDDNIEDYLKGVSKSKKTDNK